MSYRFLRNTPLCIFEREMQIIPGFDHSENYNCEYVDMLSAIICEMHYANLAQQIIQKIIALEVENLNFKDCGHQKRFNELKKTAKKQEWEFLKTGNGLAVAFLITANASLLNRAMPFITSDGFAFDKISLSGADEEMYDLYQAARFIAEGTQKLTLNDLAEPEIVGDYIVKLVMDAALINKYGEAAFKNKTLSEAMAMSRRNSGSRISRYQNV